MYAATINGQRLTFEPECVWRRNMIIRDRETGTLWQHATGEALVGPLQGQRLPLLGGELITWAGWKNAHPQTLAALEPDEWLGMLSKARVTAVLEKVTGTATAPGKVRDLRLPAHEPVIGVTIDGAARAYPLNILRDLGTVTEKVQQRDVRLIYDSDYDVVQAFLDGTQLYVQRTWWMGWFEFHPETTLFTGQGEA